MSRNEDLQRARRDRREGRTGRRRRVRDRERQAELLIAQVLDALSQRDALVDELETRAGQRLNAIRALGWPSVSDTASLCGISPRELQRLARRAQIVRRPVDPSAPAPTLNGPKAGE